MMSRKLKSDEPEEDNDKIEVSPKRELSFVEIFSIKRCAFALLVPFVIHLGQGFNMPMISTHLLHLKFQPEFMGMGQTLGAVFYIVGIILVINCFPKLTTKRGTIFIGLLIYALALCVTCNTKIDEVLLIGFASCGLGFSITILPSLPEIMDSIDAQTELKGKYDKHVLENNLGGYFVTSLALGEIIGPIS